MREENAFSLHHLLQIQRFALTSLLIQHDDRAHSNLSTLNKLQRFDLNSTTKHFSLHLHDYFVFFFSFGQWEEAEAKSKEMNNICWFFYCLLCDLDVIGLRIENF